MENSKMLFLMCGIPGSGKSTWIKNHLNADKVTIVSRDQIRNSMVPEDEEFFSKENAVFAEFINQIETALKGNKEIIIADATHLNPRARTKVLNALGSNLKSVKIGAVSFKLNVDLALERNNKRTSRALVPETAIYKMASQFAAPTYEEGFDLIIEVDGKTSASEIKNRKGE